MNEKELKNIENGILLKALIETKKIVRFFLIMLVMKQKLIMKVMIKKIFYLN